MNLLSVAKRSIGSVHGNKKNKIIGGVPIVSNSLFMNKENIGLARYYPQMNNVSVGAFQSKKEDTEDNKSVVEEAYEAVKEFVEDKSADLNLAIKTAVNNVKIEMPGIENVGHGTRARGYANHFGLDPDYVRSVSKKLDFLDGASKKLDNLGKRLGYLVFIEVAVDPKYDGKEVGYMIYEGAELIISKGVGMAAVALVNAAGVAAAAPTGGVSEAAAMYASPFVEAGVESAVEYGMDKVEDSVVNWFYELD